MGVLITVIGLTAAGLYSVMSYRTMLSGLSDRVAEMPLAAELANRVSDLRVELRDYSLASRSDGGQMLVRARFAANELDFALEEIARTLEAYRLELDSTPEGNELINDRTREWEMVARIQETMAAVRAANQWQSPDEVFWAADQSAYDELTMQLDSLQHLTNALPSYLQNKIRNLRVECQTEYHWLVGISVGTSTFSVALLIGLGFMGYRSVFRPFKKLVRGCRKIAQQNFNYRVKVVSHDEIGELAQAMNDLTGKFCDIRDQLENEVEAQAKQLLRSEKLASVGFLAAGVAHEINNPLTSMSLCAHDLRDQLEPHLSELPESDGLARRLQILITELDRCAGITERLLDFSRVGDRPKEEADLRGLAEQTLDLLTQHSAYKDKQVTLVDGDRPIIWAHAHEIKQVILNLVTNALESLDPGGTVTVSIERHHEMAELVVQDNGCGMSNEVLANLFEPFFTRRRGGQGTGLGLSITHGIVTEHGGRITATSHGAGYGSRFSVQLPLADSLPAIRAA
jgi:signal transduction histidine kinase